MSTATKLEYLNDTKQLLKENINNLGGNLTNEPFRQYASVLEGIYESLPKISGIGASLSLSPTMVGKIKLNEIQGNTLQDGTPTPSSPVPIESVTGLQNVTICDKNLLSNLLQNTITYSGTTSTINGDTWTIIKSGNGGISLNPRTEYLPLTIKTGEKVTFSTFPYSGTMTSATVHIQIRVYFYDKDKNLITNMGSGNTSQDSETTILSSTYTATQDVAYMRLGDYIASGTGTTTGLVLKMQLERGDTRTDFEPYTGNTYEVNLGTIELNKIGDYEDYIFKNEPSSPLYDDTLTLNSWYITKNIGKYVFTGNETWETSTYGTNSWTLNNVISTNYDTSKVLIISNIFKGVSNDDRATGGNNKIYFGGLDNVVYIRDTSLTTLTEVQNATNGNYAYYVRKTPTYTTITNTELINQLESLSKAKSKNGTTNINVTSEDLSMILNVGVLKGDA